VDDDGPDPAPSAVEHEPTPEREREKTVIEMMNGPARPSESGRRTVLWFSLAFATLMLALTVGVITLYGFDFLTIFTGVALCFVVAAMVGALRYKGEDPMAQFDPPERPKRRGFWRRGSV
jgi:xanthine/uracil permease